MACSTVNEVLMDFPVPKFDSKIFVWHTVATEFVTSFSSIVVVRCIQGVQPFHHLPQHKFGLHLGFPFMVVHEGGRNMRMYVVPYPRQHLVPRVVVSCTSPHTHDAQLGKGIQIPTHVCPWWNHERQSR